MVLLNISIRKKRYEYLFNQHYQDPRNTHHPEHFENQGIAGMDLLDLLEFLCDSFAYKADTITYTEASAVLDKQIERFNISEDLSWALKNTIQNYFCHFGGEEVFNSIPEVLVEDNAYTKRVNAFPGSAVDVYA